MINRNLFKNTAKLLIILLISIFFGLNSSIHPTQAATTETLVKASNSSTVYYLGNDNRRYVFPNEVIYYSWYPNFNTVNTISASELSQYPIMGNIVMRAGTKLVKIQSNSAVYAVEPNGALRKIKNETQAKSIYGNFWQWRVVDLPESLFNSYTVKTELSDGQIPAGTLVKKTGNIDYYYYDGSSYRIFINPTVLRANMFQMKDAISLSLAGSNLGTPINGIEKSLFPIQSLK